MIHGESQKHYLEGVLEEYETTTQAQESESRKVEIALLAYKSNLFLHQILLAFVALIKNL